VRKVRDWLIPRVDNELNAIKGGGACQLREKVLAEAADTWVIVADYRKNSNILGTSVCLLVIPRILHLACRNKPVWLTDLVDPRHPY
jgi:ribose 5-phosphate isomerase